MWDNRSSYPTDLVDYIPNVCPEPPQDQKAFCVQHSIVVEELGRPSNLNDFITHCGVDPDALTKDGKGKMAAILDLMAKQAKDSPCVSNMCDIQGTGYLLRNRNIANKDNLTASKKDIEDCRKDTGEKFIQKRTRSRGIFCSVSGGGIIRSWAPLYKSEGPTQVALIMTTFLQTYLGKVIPNIEDWIKFYLAYDNICHVDELKLLNEPLSLEFPYSDMWQKINKIIDPLHIKNHSREKCQELYNPERVKVDHPEANMMQCEQTFTWLGRYKNI